MNCQFCGRNLKEDSRFCDFCGVKVALEESPPFLSGKGSLDVQFLLKGIVISIIITAAITILFKGFGLPVFFGGLFLPFFFRKKK